MLAEGPRQLIINRRSVFSASITFLIFSVLPVYVQQILPLELVNTFSTHGFNLLQLLNQISYIGVIISILTLIKGFFLKGSASRLIISIASTIFWLLVPFFTLSMGEIDDLGIVTISSKAGGASNTVILDFRLLFYFVTLTIILRIFYSVLEFREIRVKRNLEYKKPVGSRELP